jgi:hypothetical protein
LAAVAQSSTGIQLLQADTGQALAAVPAPSPHFVESIFLSPTATHLAAATHDERVHVWDLRRIRETLAGMGIDWDQPPLESPANDGMTAALSRTGERTSR